MSDDFSEPVEDVIEPAKLSKNTAVMAAGTTISRVTGFVRIYAMVAAIGIGAMSDAYVLANTLPNIIYEIVLGGILSATLVPIFIGIYKSKDVEDEGGIQATFGMVLVIGLAITLLIVLFAPWIIDLYTGKSNDVDIETQRSVATYLLRLFAPQIFFYGLISFATGVLNSKRKFAAPMFAPILNNVIVIAMFLVIKFTVDDTTLAGFSENRRALTLLGLFTTLGIVAMALAMMPSLRSVGVSLRPIWRPKHAAVRRIAKLSGWTLGFVIANQLALIFILRLAHSEVGGVSAYTIAFTFFLLPHAIFAVSIMSALHPELSESWNSQRIESFKKQVSLGIRMISVIMVPAAVGYATLSHPIVNVVLPGNTSGGANPDLVAGTLAFMAIGLPAFSLYLFFTRAFQAMKDAKTAFYLYVVENVINVVLALAVYSWAGVYGLAFALSVAYIAAAIVALVILSKRVGGLNFAELGPPIIKIVFASFVMAAVIVVVRLFSEGFGVGAAVEIFIAIPLGVATYIGAARLLHLSELSLVLRGPLKRFSPSQSQS